LERGCCWCPEIHSAPQPLTRPSQHDNNAFLFGSREKHPRHPTPTQQLVTRPPPTTRSCIFDDILINFLRLLRALPACIFLPFLTNDRSEHSATCAPRHLSDNHNHNFGIHLHQLLRLHPTHPSNLALPSLGSSRDRLSCISSIYLDAWLPRGYCHFPVESSARQIRHRTRKTCAHSTTQRRSEHLQYPWA
jgi:hypothetical protein